ncbi:hypothetical protein R1sor_015422 [Riccia sorocarpa]|uniref:Uncharacterized protein n=1 Tax=Riccia sorocarpa TaxID=122646 RepID=A0ABD3HCI9_9MARC
MIGKTGRETYASKHLGVKVGSLARTDPRCFRGRWPKDPFSRLGYFKAKEHTNFVLYCVPYILYVMGYVPGMVLCDLGRLVFEIARYFYISSRSETGWTEDMLNKCRMLFASWRIRHEEDVGATGSIMDHVAGMGRVYWCYAFERLVVSYNKIKTNSRHIETTFTSHYVRSFFSVCCDAMWEDEDGILPDQRIQTLLEQHTVHLGDDTVRSQGKGIIYVTSERSTKLMMNRLMSELPDHNGTKSLDCIEAWNNGIGVGPKIRCQGNINRGVH